MIFYYFYFYWAKSLGMACDCGYKCVFEYPNSKEHMKLIQIIIKVPIKACF